MTSDEAQVVQSKINELETEAAKTRDDVRDVIEVARKMNDAARVGQAKLRAIASQVEPLKGLLAEHVSALNAETKRQANEAAKAAAEAKAKEPPEPTLLDIVSAKIDARFAQLEKALEKKAA